MRKAFGKDDLRKTFTEIGKKLQKPVEIFLLGGGAMCFRDQKNATNDLDLVFKTEAECSAFCEIAEQLGFKKDKVLDSEYQKMMATGVWNNSNGFRLDVFLKTVCRALELTEKMAARSELLGDFGKLTVKIVSNEDVILFKGITERPDDANDIAAIVRTAKIDWNAILEECVFQSKKRPWYGLLHDKLVEIKEKHGIDAPITKKLSRLDLETLLKEAFERRISEGISRSKALEELRKRGFTKKELQML